MKPLSQVLNDTKPMPEQTQVGTAHNMQVHGSIHLDGKVSGISKEESQSNQSQSQSTREQKKLSDCPQDQSRLTSLLLICFDTLDTFGKEPEQLKNVAEMFRLVLGRFTINQIEAAFKIYIEKNTVMPKPADIVKIIEPPAEPRKWCGATFIDIKRRTRENQFITNAEKQYCEDFIAARIKEPDNSGMIEDALKQVEQQNKQYYLE